MYGNSFWSLIQSEQGIKLKWNDYEGIFAFFDYSQSVVSIHKLSKVKGCPTHTGCGQGQAELL